MNFTPICDSRVAHIRLVCCALGFLFGAKFPQSSLILWGDFMWGVLSWEKILAYAKYAAVLERVCYCCIRLSICTFERVGLAFLFGAKFPQSSLILWGDFMWGVLSWEKILTYAKYAAVLERVYYCCTRLSICTFGVEI